MGYCILTGDVGVSLCCCSVAVGVLSNDVRYFKLPFALLLSSSLYYYNIYRCNYNICSDIYIVRSSFQCLVLATD